MLKKKVVILIILLSVGAFGFFILKTININPEYKVGKQIDQFNGVAVYYNGNVGHISGRELTADGYNLGLKHQCVEFVKRYYYEALNHKMPNSYGHAKDFFDNKVSDGKINKGRNLIQYSNPSLSKPRLNDLVVYSGTVLNKYGHVSIISQVTDKDIEIIQQNPGPFGDSRKRYHLIKENDKWKINNHQILGWLRKK
ncbi:CHAP domain-containing protein [Winogradskyella undariae]|uniref:CHAP domain-containing protein n=1 Tax=Winogradskyella undariae TaxID=1285465 RepID=UPI0015C777B1|nr:CHAP domain-containing protein [Winogradskyella undariae]